MKKAKIILLLILIVVLMCVSGCITPKYTDVLSNDITIYKITRDSFISFLQNPSYNIFQNESIDSYTYSEDGEWFVTADFNRFRVEQQLIDFAGNSEELKRFLFQNSIDVNIKNTIVFDSPQAPITIWIETSTEHVFVTVDEEIDDESYVYRLYNYADFYEKYKVRDATLIVKGEYVESKNVAKLYYNDADIPLIATLQELGAIVTWQNETNVTIECNGKIFCLDIATPILYEFDKQDENILHQIFGGPIFIYSAENELMVNCSTFNYVMSVMGEDVLVRRDIQNAIVTIE